MEDKPNIDNIINAYANALADVELGVRLEQHLEDINLALPEVDLKVIEFINNKSAAAGMYELGYCLYHLRDRILEQLKTK